MRGLPAYEMLTAAGPVYITFDMDVLDPAFAPGVSHREPGGMSVREAIAHLHAIGGEIVGADLVEFNPVQDLHDEARRIMKAHGADVRDGSERVRFDSDMILELVSHCPSEFTIHARNPAHNVRFGGNNLILSMMASAPNCSDLDRGRRPGNQQDFRNFLKLAQMHNILNCTGGYPVEPIDIHPSRSATSNASATSPR